MPQLSQQDFLILLPSSKSIPFEQINRILSPKPWTRDRIYILGESTWLKVADSYFLECQTTKLLNR